MKINDFVQDIVSAIFAKNKSANLSSLMLHWQEIVGVKFSQTTFPTELKFNSGSGATLIIAIQNSSIGIEIMFLRKEIQEKANFLLGQRVINKIALNCTPELFSTIAHI